MRTTYKRGDGGYTLKDGINRNGENPFDFVVNLLGKLEDILLDREFWYIADVYGNTCAVPVTVQGINEGGFTVVWAVTDEYTQEYEEIDITELYASYEDAVLKIIAEEGGNSYAE